MPTPRCSGGDVAPVAASVTTSPPMRMRPRSRTLEPGDAAQRGRLAAAARPEQRDEFARPDGETDVVDGAHAAVMLQQALDPKARGFAHRSACASADLIEPGDQPGASATTATQIAI